MSPLFKRLAGLLGRAAPAAPPSEEPAGVETERRRRRRGGRGRGGGGGGSAGAPPGQTTTAPQVPVARAPEPSRTSAPRGRGPEPSQRSNNSYDRRRTPRRLDQPLPEDIAFRPPAEGGDRSILPSRRRPPPGLKATKRVLVAGSRFVPRGPGGLEDDADEFAEEAREAHEAGPAVVRAEDDAAPSETARTGRRRRGRRGGRGRRRGDGSPPASDAPSADGS